MKKILNITLYSATVLTLTLSLCAFRLPSGSAAGLVSVETIQNQINNFKMITIISLFILGMSILVNIFLVLYIFKIQNEVSEMTQAIKNFNATQEAVNKIAEKVKVYTATKEKDEKIEFIKRGE